tara:strand:+ start:333 stop:551 length:219 start_codon:yes stop_codon:yes gene_type:complete
LKFKILKNIKDSATKIIIDRPLLIDSKNIYELNSKIIPVISEIQKNREININARKEWIVVSSGIAKTSRFVI